MSDPCSGQTYLLIIYNNGEVAGSSAECMCWFRIEGQLFARCSSKDDQPAQKVDHQLESLITKTGQIT